MATGDGKRQQPRAKIKWPVQVKTPNGIMDGVTLNLSTDSAFIRCARPLKLSEVFDMVISAPDHPLKARAEVVWSNIYGPDDEITPRGMGVRFLSISSGDRQFIAKAALEHLKSEGVESSSLEFLQTLALNPDAID